MVEYPTLCVRANDVSFLGLIRATSEVININNTCGVFSWQGAPKWYSDVSKHLNNCLQLPNPAEYEDDCLLNLIEFGKSNYSKFNKKTLVLCSSDVNEVFFQIHAKELGQYFYLPGEKSASRIRDDISDKGKFFELLNKSLPQYCPKTVSIRSKQCLLKLNDWKVFPCVVKPSKKDLSQSFYRLHNGDKALLVHSRSSLKDVVGNLINLNYELVVQEYIDFDSLEDEVPTYAYFDRNSELKIYCNCVKKYIFPKNFGTALSVEVTCDEVLIEATKQIGSLIGWFGPLMIEFVKDRQNGRLVVLEVNTRPWLFHDFYRQIGLNFVPQYLTDLAGGKPQIDLQTPDKDQLQYSNINLIDFAKLIPSELTDVKSRTSWLLNEIDFETMGEFYFTHFDKTDIEPYLLAMNDLKFTYNVDVEIIDRIIKR